jgi:hypothetical protein
MIPRFGRTTRAKVLVPAALLGLIGAISALAGWGPFARQPPASLAYHARVGQMDIYRLEYASASTLDAGPGFAIDMAVCGDVVRTAIRVDEDGAEILWTLREAAVRIAVNGSERPDDAGEIAADLGREVVVRIDRAGRVVALWPEPRAPGPSVALVRTLLAATQFVLPLDAASPDAWEREEEDALGRYVASYRAEPAPAGGTPPPPDYRTFRKEKLRDLPPRRTGSRGAAMIVPGVRRDGHLLARFDLGSGRLVSLHGEEGHEMGLADLFRARTRATVKLEYVRTDSLGATELEAARRAGAARMQEETALRLWTVVETEEARRARYRGELSGATAEALLAELATVDAAGPDADTTALYLKLQALAALEPDFTRTLRQRLIAGDPESHAIGLVISALAGAGHPEAQNALVDALAARARDAQAQLAVMDALAGVTAPTDVAEAALRKLSGTEDDDVASTARLSLGTMAGTLADSSPQRAARLVGWAVQELDAATSNAGRVLMLLALGNAGSARALEAIARHGASPSAQVRGAAAFALRWIDSPAADELLRKVLLADADGDVRAQAAAAFQFRDLTAETFEAHTTALRKDDSIEVRLAVIENLWEARDRFPAARDAVEEAAVKDESEEVRNASLLQAGHP